MEIFLSLTIVLGLILLNGFFSGAEIAIISLRKSRTKTLADEGNKRAALVKTLQDNPDSFFATVQIGVTLVSVFASAFGAVGLAPKLEFLFKEIPYIGLYHEQFSFILIVVMITYLSLVFGELVPKSLALHSSEKFALFVAYPLHFFSRVFNLFTRFLTFSSNVVLKPFRDKTSFSETRLSPEEILQMVEEGVRAGTIKEAEHELIENVLEIHDTTAREIMVPRVDLTALPVDADYDRRQEMISTFYSRVPVFDENLDNIIGILHIKDLMRAMVREEAFSLVDLVRPVYYVPDAMKIGQILQEMQKRKNHMAIVVDEYGGTNGLLTMEDILEEIVGEIDEVLDDPDEQKILTLSDGSFLVSGSCSIIDFNEFFESTRESEDDHSPVLPESDAYTSVAGFTIKNVGRFPEVGEKIILDNLVLELVKRVRQKLVQFRLTQKSASPLSADSEKK